MSEIEPASSDKAGNEMPNVEVIEIPSTFGIPLSIVHHSIYRGLSKTQFQV